MNQYCIGSTHVPGLSKLIEEQGEVLQIAGKIMGLGSLGEHWDGSNLARRLAEELADVEAAIIFMRQWNELPDVGGRVGVKLGLFNKWHREGLRP